uniref:GRAS protein n=1 Tax=Datisca glomerata TaxID=34297 RepID=A0A6M3RHZ9_DATGL|nr:GRAS protein [Datisca glomerata]
MTEVVNSAMALAMDDSYIFDHLDLSSYSTSATTDDGPEHGCNWDDWSPMVDWDTFTDLIGGPILEDLKQYPTGFLDDSTASISNSAGSSTDMIIIDEEINNNRGGDGKGLRLIHLLMAAAEALTGANPSRDLARVILVRLKELVSPVDGSNMERLAAYFTDALHGLLDGTKPGSRSNDKSRAYFLTGGTHSRDDYNPTDVLAAFQLLQDMSPYVKFGHFTANQAILEAVANERRVHIVDYDVMEGIQWASFMQSLVSRKDGSPAPHLRITAITRGGGGAGRKSPSMSSVQETGRRLTAFAASIGQPFSFHQCRLDSDETFRPSVLKLVRGEALVVNCMLHLPHLNYRTPDSVMSFLSGAKSLNPRVITLVEEEVGLTNGGFYAWFVDSLHHYSAMYDSLEAGFPMQNKSRSLVERVFLGPQIAGSLARIYCSQGRGGEKKTGLSWGEWLGGVGFRGVPISYGNHCQAKLLLGLFNDGYRVEEMGNNKLVLGWKSRRLFSASVWAPPPNLDFDSCTGSVP